MNSSPYNRRSLITICILSLIATAVAGYLAWITFVHGTIAACGDEPSHMACDDVLRSPWSRWLGIPVSFLACLTYFAIFLTSVFILVKSDGKHRATAESALLGLVTLAVGSAVWFVFLQAFVLGAFCKFCMAVHTCGIIVFAMLLPQFSRLMRGRRERQKETQLATLQHATVGKSAPTRTSPDQVSSGQRLWPVAAATAALVLLISVQIVFPAKTYEVHDVEIAENISTSIDDSQEDNNLSDESDDVESTDPSLPPDVEPPSTTEPTPPEEGNQDQPESAPVASNASTDATTDHNAVKSREVALLQGKLTIDVYQHGLLGSPEAEFVIIELVDYTCHSCRQVHQYMRQAHERYGDQLAIVILPVPLETSCNPFVRNTTPDHVGACKYARLALAVLALNPGSFYEFHNWMMQSELPPSIEEASEKATEFAGLEQLRMGVKSEPVLRQLRGYIQVFAAVGVTRFPVLIMGDKVVTGVPNNPEELFQLLEKNTGVKPSISDGTH